jgi:hypothetical protein
MKTNFKEQLCGNHAVGLSIKQPPDCLKLKLSKVCLEEWKLTKMLVVCGVNNIFPNT